MTSTYTTNQGIEKPAAGDQSGTWGGTVNTNMDIIDRAICGVASLTLTGSTTTLTTTDGTLTDGMYRVLILGDGGDLGSDNTITISPNDQSKCYLVYNNLTANRNAIFTQGSGGNITVSNGATAWIYADGAGAGAEVRQGMVSTEIADQDGDTKIQVEEGGDDDDTIRFDIAGAEDFQMRANTFEVQTGSNIDMNGTELILDADGDTSITADSDDTIDFRIAGADDFQMTANTLSVLSGSTLNIDSGATIANSGTATGFGATSVAVLQATKNSADADTTQSITGAGFTPTLCLMLTAKAHDAVLGLGFTDGTITGGAFNESNQATAGDYDTSGGMSNLIVSSGNRVIGNFGGFTADGIDIDWVKTGSPTGFFSFTFLLVA